MERIILPTLPDDPKAGEPVLLPPAFLTWFAQKGWQPRAHQLDLLAQVQAGNSALLIAPTGAGKTLAGFLPSLVDLAERGRRKPGEAFTGIHTLYISPLKALAVDIERNLTRPVEEMRLPVTLETRTGDTPPGKRQRQKLTPPDILLTTPEQLALLISAKDAARFFKDLKFVIFDELHSLVTSKRGHLLALGRARLRKLRPEIRTIGLSATVAEPEELQAWLVGQTHGEPLALSRRIVVEGGAKPIITILKSDERVPWAGHSARYAMSEVYEAIKAHRTTLLFVNTRSQAEMLFRALDIERGRAADRAPPWLARHRPAPQGRGGDGEGTAEGRRCHLDARPRHRLGRCRSRHPCRRAEGCEPPDAQRIGRSNHRMDEPSRAILVPANRFEVLECRAALDANYLGAQDTPPLRRALDVLAQHVLGMACAEPFDADALYAEITSACALCRNVSLDDLSPRRRFRRDRRLRAEDL
jgi:ATP-dependent Lhr-like helicase